MSRWSSLSEEGKQRRRASNNLWRDKNRDKARAHGRKHYKNNAEKRKAYSRKRHAELRSPEYLFSMAKRTKEARLANPLRHFYNRIRTVYGLTKEQYDTLLEQQRGVCAVCEQPESHTSRGKVKRLAIDHCHATGRVRGLLCHRCNIGLGQFCENPTLLRQLASWIESQQ